MHRVMVSYLKASKEQRVLMAAAMPDIFTPEVCEELASADDIIRDSSAAAKDALSYGNTLFSEIGVGSTANTAAISTAAERGITLYDDEGRPLVGTGDDDTNLDEDDLVADGLATFEEILSSLMAKQQEATALVSREPQPAGDGAALVTSGKTNMTSRAAEDTAASKGCVLLPSLLLQEIFSFLPILDIIETTEHVCHYWNAVTTASTTAQAFWIGCVHREYPTQLAAMIAAEGPALFEADWRTIGTVIVCNELAEDDDEEEDA